MGGKKRVRVIARVSVGVAVGFRIKEGSLKLP